MIRYIRIRRLRVGRDNSGRKEVTAQNYGLLRYVCSLLFLCDKLGSIFKQWHADSQTVSSLFAGVQQSSARSGVRLSNERLFNYACPISL